MVHFKKAIAIHFLKHPSINIKKIARQKLTYGTNDLYKLLVKRQLLREKKKTTTTTKNY